MPDDESSAASVDDANARRKAHPSRADLLSLASQIVQARVAPCCKRYCFDNRARHQCTVDKRWGLSSASAPLCEWGNATYLWMMEELASDTKLASLKGKGVVHVDRYWQTVVNSGLFWERFKDWRFRRRLRVPAYIKALHPNAHRIFWALCDGDSVANIAQRLGRGEVEVAEVVALIRRALSVRGRGDLLEPTKVVPLHLDAPDEDEGHELDIPAETESHEETDLRARLLAAYSKLTWQEQFLIDAMIIDELSAADTLQALVEQGVSLDGATPPQALNVQNVYYHLRKTVARLRKLASIDEDLKP